MSSLHKDASEANRHPVKGATGAASGHVYTADGVGDASFQPSPGGPPSGPATGDLGGTYPAPTVAAITETSGPQQLTFGSIAEGQFVTRSGTSLIGAPPPGTPVFGTEYDHEEDPTLSQTNSTSPIQKLELTTANLPAGAYRLEWSYVWSRSSATNDFFGRIRQGASTVLTTHRQEAKEAGTDNLVHASSALYLSLSGVQSFFIDYWGESAGATSYIQEAQLTIWRVA